jgi:signal transduction histidine kinase
LVKYIFSAEKFDLGKTKLYRSTLNISKFMQCELDYFQHNYKNINFNWSIQEWIIYEIDEIQFRQVIQNLINNAIKFINRDNPKIQISLGNKWKNIIVTIEDNWEWFSKNDSESIFDKYITGSWNATGLGMGLYLCKKIIELHDWDISVSQSDDLGWAKFTIRL